MKNGVKLIGNIGVDAGLCWIGDPCYILHQKGEDKKALNKVIGKDWGQFCDKLFKQDGAQMKYPLGHDGLGVCFGGFGGDGTYGVYAEYRDGLIAKVFIDFAGDETDEDED